jgi:hypothetical protein
MEIVRECEINSRMAFACGIDGMDEIDCHKLVFCSSKAAEEVCTLVFLSV